MEVLAARRITCGQRRGSSRPVLVETAAGPRIVKLCGAAQGTGPLVAEIVVARLAEALGLRVPARCLVRLERDTPCDDRDDELAQLLAMSVGINLGFELLDGAREMRETDLARLEPCEAAALLWLDRFVLNPDRSRRNPNLLWWRERAWLIDHGAALWFQYDWPAVREDTPRDPGGAREPHLFETLASSPDWPAWDAMFASSVTREALESALEEVPDEFLAPLLAASARMSAPIESEALRRRRAAYVAFLWKRLKPPRAFASDARSPKDPAARRGPPEWLANRPRAVECDS